MKYLRFLVPVGLKKKMCKLFGHKVDMYSVNMALGLGSQSSSFGGVGAVCKRCKETVYFGQ